MSTASVRARARAEDFVARTAIVDDAPAVGGNLFETGKRSGPRFTLAPNGALGVTLETMGRRHHQVPTDVAPAVYREGVLPVRPLLLSPDEPYIFPDEIPRRRSIPCGYLFPTYTADSMISLNEMVSPVNSRHCRPKVLVPPSTRFVTSVKPKK